MKRWAVALGVLVVVLAGAAFAALPLIERHIAEEMRSHIEARGIAKVGGIEVGVFRRRIVLSGVAVTPPGATQPTLTVARIDAAGLGWPVAELLAGRTPFAGWRWGDPVSVDRVELDDVRLLDPALKIEGRVEKLVVEGIDLPRFEPAAALFPSNRTQELSALAAVRIKRLEQRGWLLSSREEGGLGLSGATIVVENYDRGLIGTVKVSGTDLRILGVARPELSIGEMAGRGIDIRLPLDRLKAAMWRPGMAIGRVAAEQIVLSGFSGDLLGRVGVTLDRIVAETVREKEAATRSRTRVEGLTVRPSGSGREGVQVQIALLSMGVREIKAEIDCAFIEDHAKGELEIDKCSVNSDGLVELSLAARIVQADELFWQAFDGGDLADMIGSTAALASAEVILRDGGLLAKLLKIYADSTGQEVAVARAQIALEVRRFMPTDVLITEDLTKLADTVARFVERGGALTITATPDPPLGFERLIALNGNGADVVDVLGLKATLSRR